ncbi:hypothetical protein BS78_06G273000 [Paspalum vaginatum]|nr:hypothetical protein BS78_06G273000 [Paspalum vaginatum]
MVQCRASDAARWTQISDTGSIHVRRRRRQRGWGLDLEDAADDFCDAYSAFLRGDANEKSAVDGGTGWMAGSCGGDDGEAGSPATRSSSGVTADDGPLLMDDGGGGGGLTSVSDYFGDDPLLAGGEEAASSVAAAAGGGGQKNGLEEQEEHALGAREGEQASRKRARNKIKGTSLMPWGELEVTRMHLAPIQLPPPPLVCCMS